MYFEKLRTLFIYEETSSMRIIFKNFIHREQLGLFDECSLGGSTVDSLKRLLQGPL
jgi:hypothetical protein